jgi:hypothetical protein
MVTFYFRVEIITNLTILFVSLYFKVPQRYETGTYNVRAFSSMSGGTFFSEVTQSDRRGQGTLTTTEFVFFIGTTIERLQLRLERERYFLWKKIHVDI